MEMKEAAERQMKKKRKRNQEKENTEEAVLPWMRNPLDISLLHDSPLHLLPFFDPRFQEIVGPGLFERDLCINSPTGSGKTLSYALPIVQMLSTRIS